MDVTIAGVVWWQLVTAIFAALFLINGIPHFVHGVSGQQFPTPFSGGPPRLDSAPRNVMWGGFNLLVGVLLLWASAASLAAPLFWVVFGLAGFGGALLLATAFSRGMAPR